MSAHNWLVLEDNMERHALKHGDREIVRVFVAFGTLYDPLFHGRMYYGVGQLKRRMYRIRKRVGAANNLELYRLLTTRWMPERG